MLRESVTEEFNVQKAYNKSEVGLAERRYNKLDEVINETRRRQSYGVVSTTNLFEVICRKNDSQLA